MGRAASALAGLFSLALTLFCVYPAPLLVSAAPSLACSQQVPHTLLPLCPSYKPSSICSLLKTPVFRSMPVPSSVPPPVSMGLCGATVQGNLPGHITQHCWFIAPRVQAGLEASLRTPSLSFLREVKYKTPLFWRPPNSSERSRQTLQCLGSAQTT